MAEQLTDPGHGTRIHPPGKERAHRDPASPNPNPNWPVNVAYNTLVKFRTVAASPHSAIPRFSPTQVRLTGRDRTGVSGGCPECQHLMDTQQCQKSRACESFGTFLGNLIPVPAIVLGGVF